MVNGHIVKDQTNFRWNMHKYISEKLPILKQQI